MTSEDQRKRNDTLEEGTRQVKQTKIVIKELEEKELIQ
jgi:hypothetical protein